MRTPEDDGLNPTAYPYDGLIPTAYPTACQTAYPTAYPPSYHCWYYRCMRDVIVTAYPIRAPTA